MRKVRVIFVVAISAFFTGCPVRSLQPLFSEKDLTYNPALVGKWADGEDIYSFSRANENEYAILLTEQKPTDSTTNARAEVDTITFVGRLGRLGKNWFLDTYPARETGDFHLLPTHIIAKVRIEGDTLTLASLEGDWLKKMLKAGHLRTECTLVDGDVILTGPTKEIQQMVRKYADDENAFPGPEKFVRVK